MNTDAPTILCTHDEVTVDSHGQGTCDRCHQSVDFNRELRRWVHNVEPKTTRPAMTAEVAEMAHRLNPTGFRQPSTKTMSTPNEQMETPISPSGFENGLSIEHILLSVTVVHGKGSCGQVDDSAAGILRRELMKYNGVKSVRAEVQYAHTKIEQHSNDCQCWKCTYTEHPAPES